MAEYFAGGHLRFINGEWRDDNGNVIKISLVRNGKWIRRKSCHTQTGFIDKCSVCQNMLVHLGCKTNYCPNCGAKMDLKGE